MRLLLFILLLPLCGTAQTTPTGAGRKFTFGTQSDGDALIWNAAAGFWTNQPAGGGGDAGGTNSRQHGTLNLTNWSNITTNDMANIPAVNFLTNWANAISNLTTAVTNAPSVTNWIGSRQTATATLTNLSGNPIPFTNILVQGANITLTTNSGVVTIAGTGGGSSETIALASANIVNTNTAFVDATNLTFAVSAGVNYRFRFVIHYTTAATTTGARFAINGPASPTALRVGGILPTGTAAMNSGSQTAYNTAIFAATTGPGSTAVTGVIEGVFRNGANAGTLALRVASEIGTSAVTILADSYGELQSF